VRIQNLQSISEIILQTNIIKIWNNNNADTFRTKHLCKQIEGCARCGRKALFLCDKKERDAKLSKFWYVDSLGSEACLYVCWIWKLNPVSQKVVLDKFHWSPHTSFTVAICDREAEWAPRSGPPEEMEPLSCHKYGIWNSERVHHCCASFLILRLKITVLVWDRV